MPDHITVGTYVLDWTPRREMIMDRTQVSSLGGRRRAELLTPQERKESSRRAYLAGAVRTICRQVHTLTPDQMQALRDALREGN